MLPSPGNIFWPYSRQFFCGIIKYNTGTGGTNFNTKVDLHQPQFIRFQNSYIYKNPPAPQGRDVQYVANKFICRQLGNAQKCRQYRGKHHESFVPVR